MKENLTNIKRVDLSEVDHFYIMGSTRKDGLLGVGNVKLDLKALASSDESPDEGPNTNGHDYVDLGLPSGTLWATKNVGATSPEDGGGYYAWGEISEKSSYTVENYKYYGGSEGGSDIATKYNVIDGLTQLEKEDDVASAIMGGDWEMPTKEQLEELVTFTTKEVVVVENTELIKFSAQNGNYILIPLSGIFEGDSEVDYEEIFLISKNIPQTSSEYFNYTSIFLLYSTYSSYGGNTNITAIVSDYGYRQCGHHTRGVISGTAV